MRKIYVCFLLLALMPVVLFAASNKKKVKAVPDEPVVMQPVRQHPTAFAIIADKSTFTQCQDAIMKYRDAVEHDGLSTYVVYANWRDPMQVRTVITQLYQECPMLEGIVLVGDIPVAMIRNAQHMRASAVTNMQPSQLSWKRLQRQNTRLTGTRSTRWLPTTAAPTTSTV